MFGDLFFQFLTLFKFGGYNFLISNLFCQMCQEGFKFCLDIRTNGALPLDLACPDHLSVGSLAGLPYITDCTIQISLYMCQKRNVCSMASQPLHTHRTKKHSNNFLREVPTVIHVPNVCTSDLPLFEGWRSLLLPFPRKYPDISLHCYLREEEKS